MADEAINELTQRGEHYVKKHLYNAVEKIDRDEHDAAFTAVLRAVTYLGRKTGWTQERLRAILQLALEASKELP